MLQHISPEGDIHVSDAMKRLFFHSTPLQLNNEVENVTFSSHLLQPSTKAKLMSEAYHRYALNYINALNYLETLRRHQDFCDFEKVAILLRLHLMILKWRESMLYSTFFNILINLNFMK